MEATKKNNVITIEFEEHDTLQSPMLYQYDTGQKIKFVDVPDGVEVQFSNENSETTDNRILADSQVEIPDFLISEGLEITAYIQYINDQSETTTKVLTIPIECRTKQQDIVPDEDKGAFRRQIEQIMNDTKKAAEEAADKVESNKEFLDKAEKAAEASENSAGKSKEYMDATDANRRTVEGLTEKNKEYATQTESNAESANTSASNASESASNASQSASNAASSATNASASATKAAASEKNAKASEENVKKSESNVNQAVAEFEQKRADSIAEINKTTTDSQNAINTLTTNSKKEISDLTETKKTELNKINNDITNNASSLKEAIVNAADAKKEEINQKGLEVLASIPEDMEKIQDTTLIKSTESGTEINLTDSSDMNIQELHFFGKSEQKTTKGIQLLNLKDAKGGTGEGVTYTINADGSIARKGTATGYIANVWLKGGYYENTENKEIFLILEAGKKYYIKDVVLTNGQVSVTSKNKVESNYLVTINENEYPEGFKVTGIRNPAQTSGKTYDDIIYPIVAESSTAIEWEEYTGGQPSPSPDYPKEIESVENPSVTIQGKNLYSIFKNNPYVKEQLTNGVTYTPNADGSVTIKGKATTTSRYILINSQLSAKLFARHIDEQYTIKIFGLPSNCCYEMSFAGVKYGETKNTFTNVKKHSKERYTEIRIPEGVAVNTTIYPMLVLGDTINEYEPYKQIQTVTFNHSLNGIDDVKDELIIRADGTGQLIQRLLEEELNANSNYVLWYENTNTYGFLTKESKWLYRANKTNIKSNKLKGITKEVGNPGTYDKNGIFVDTAGLYIKISKKYLTEYTVDALKTYLRDNPITVVGLLKEPIVTELSSEEVQKILALHTNKPNTTIWNDQDAEMQVTYVADTKSYIDNKMAELQALLLEKGE